MTIDMSGLRNLKINRAGQGGNALIICLIFMLLMTILGVGTMRSAVLQERMAGNVRDTNTALQSSEAALREAETFLSANYSSATFNGSNGLYDCQSTCSSPATSAWSDRGSITGTSWKTVTAVSLSNVGSQPQYVIEKLKPQASAGGSLKSSGGSKILLFRITARGFGVGTDTSSSSMVVLQSYYRIEQ